MRIHADPDPQHWRERWLSRDMSGNVETSYSSLARIAVSVLQIRIQPFLTTIKKRRMQRRSYGIMLKTVSHKKDKMTEFGDEMQAEVRDTKYDAYVRHWRLIKSQMIRVEAIRHYIQSSSHQVRCTEPVGLTFHAFPYDFVCTLYHTTVHYTAAHCYISTVQYLLVKGPGRQWSHHV
jgi:hypothetical protein